MRSFAPVLAQCAMCGLSRGNDSDMAWLAGALTLLIPAAGIIGGIAWIAWKHRK